MKKDINNTDDLEFKEQKIVDVHIEKEVKKSFIEYAMSVIMSRALPDARDGLKPVHRRILYTMYEDNLTYDRPFNKSVATVGVVLARYHPHGDASVYDALVRMAQDFSLRYPLIEGQGNFGNIDGDEAAAYRYTEARMERIANEMLTDIEKNVVDFQPNFDNKREEPVVLPSGFPNLLVNGSIGIAVGMATNIPPHNLCEVIDGTIYLIDNPDAEVTDLMEFIKGPDFPTGAIICGNSGIYSAYTTGKGRILVRGRAEVDEENRRIIITEIPYQVNKANLVEAIANCVKDKRIEDITGLRDESGKAGMRIVVEYKREANGQVILNQLYKYTQLQDTCAVNMLALVGNEPKILNLKELLQIYIDHRINVVTRRTKFDLEKAQSEMHIYEGFKIAIDNIDEVIRIIRASESVSAAREALMQAFSLTEAQAQAIVDMTLGKLSGMERQKIEDRLLKLEKMVEELQIILSDENKIKQIIKDELTDIKTRYGDERRTELAPLEDEIILEDLIDRHTCVITMTHAGYIKRQPADVYTAQRRGGKGIIGMTTKEEDFVEHVIAINSHSYLLMFTNTGKVHIKKAYLIPEAGRTSKGTNIVNILDLEEGEKITTLVSVKDFPEDEYLMFVTKNGTIKRTRLSEYERQRKGGKRALSLDEGDELVFVRRTRGDDEIIIATHEGNAVRFDERDARVMGRNARGVRGIKLNEGDYVTGVALVDESKYLITITEKGFGKRSRFEEFATRNRGGKGVLCHNITDKTGKLASIATVDETDDIMLITNDGTIIRTHVSEIPVYGRAASGVIVMRTNEDSFIVNFAKVATVDEKEIDEEKANDSKPDRSEENEPFDDDDDEEDTSDEDSDDLDI